MTVSLVPLYIAAITAVMLATAIWFYLRRDLIGMAVCLIIAGLALYVMLR